MSLTSKIKLFFILPVFSLLIVSCQKNNNDVIPNDYFVYFTIDINDFPYLMALGGSDTIKANDIRITFGRENSGGYKNNGIIIYAGADQYYAYDRTCPHDFVTDGSIIKVRLDSQFAKCLKCGTVYALAAGGTPYTGIGRYPLKNYRTRFDGRYLTVWNY